MPQTFSTCGAVTDVRGGTIICLHRETVLQNLEELVIGQVPNIIVQKTYSFSKDEIAFNLPSRIPLRALGQSIGGVFPR